MSRRWYVDNDCDGRPQFVTIKRSRSYHHHNHKHHTDYYKVSREQWEALVEQNRVLAEANEAFGAQNEALRTSLSVSQAETQRLSYAVVPQLQEQIAALSAEIHALRHGSDTSSSRHHRELNRLRARVAGLETENKQLIDENADLRYRLAELSKQLDQGSNRRIAELTQELDYFKNQRRYWKSQFENLTDHYDSLRKILDAKSKKLAKYEDILRRHCLI
ncbi:hypothetical protein B0T10DRAFT_563868 [Thelonectria olida]|uniref:BRE1-like coiled-coil containing domain-containing protein n=1 Tax=Thelonectria olida TaxID=1576542 RepID=A0A9P9AQA9_9HYPO|nr:hypothetical protein B0T10DRAFT_563868 [Thelonectria olida]